MSFDEHQSPPEYSSQSWAHREVRPEALDSIDPGDPLAIRARQQLDTVNFFMGNHRWLIRQLRRHLRPGWRILELGAGSGQLGHQIIDHLDLNPQRLIGNDLLPCPESWPKGASWSNGNALTSDLPDAEVVVANLLLHQFQDSELQRLAANLPKSCQLLLTVDPLRSRFALWEGKIMAALTRMDALTKHDMVISVHAGFQKNELPEALQLKGWTSHVSTTFRGGYRMVIKRELR